MTWEAFASIRSCVMQGHAGGAFCAATFGHRDDLLALNMVTLDSKDVSAWLTGLRSPSGEHKM